MSIGRSIKNSRTGNAWRIPRCIPLSLVTGTSTPIDIFLVSRNGSCLDGCSRNFHFAMLVSLRWSQDRFDYSKAESHGKGKERHVSYCPLLSTGCTRSVASQVETKLKEAEFLQSLSQIIIVYYSERM